MMDAEEHCAVNNIDDDVDTSINGTFNDVDDDHCYSEDAIGIDHYLVIRRRHRYRSLKQYQNILVVVCLFSITIQNLLKSEE